MISFTVYGKPVPQGSSKAFFVKSLGRSVITSDNTKLKPFRQQVSATAAALNLAPMPKETAVAIVLDFYFNRPTSAPKRRLFPTVPPDLDKLCRSLFDALTGILYVDDAQIVEVTARKHYAAVERVEIHVHERNMGPGLIETWDRAQREEAYGERRRQERLAL